MTHGLFEMADPTIQTFCCRHNNKTDMAVVIMQEFNTDMYNTVCMVSSAIGIVGAIYQVLPREVATYQHRWQSFSSSRGREIIIWLAVADFFAALGVFVRSALWMKYKTIMPTENDTSSVVFCAISSAWTQYFYMATWIWTLCYAIDMKLLLGEKPGRPFWYHLSAWTCPAILTTFGLSLLYLPDANCHESTNLRNAILRFLPNYCATYGLMAIVMIVNPVLYLASTKDLQTAVTCSLAQMTGRERKLVQTIRLKFALTNIVYWICWLPNLINGILLWSLWFHLPAKTVIILWYIMAVTNPLQAFCNALVYQRWGKRAKFSVICKKLICFRNNNDSKCISSEMNEGSPLLSSQIKGCTPHTSINGSSSL